jgi:succinate dehydrogenase / fumarate reductase, membrane anchor subunit
MVTRTLRQTVGAHYGWKDWLAQRITAVVMALYTLVLLGIALYNGGIDYALWRALFSSGAFQIATVVFGLALLWHAWIGVRDIWMDYIKPTALRLTLEVLTVVLLIAYLGWLVQILWGSR